ncbi:hypothetical protein [Kitasatospora phosalacinea]|uniref:HPr kinase/phosphorylase C-terminal domain-containing protein n=1 Tax=Kitasatospora phosalacinea TaxID=2065 RepID=A0ABW6GM37_9ACTN
MNPVTRPRPLLPGPVGTPRALVRYGWLDLHLDATTDHTLLRTLQHGAHLPPAEDTLHLALDEGRLLVDGRPHPTDGTSSLALAEAAYRHLHERLHERADRQGWLRLHAAAVERDGVRLLLAGPSGTGKTTLALHLQRHGWQLLGDEAVYLRGGLTAPLPRRVHVRPATAAALPHLADTPDPVTLPYRPPLLTLDPARLQHGWTPAPAPAAHLVLLRAHHHGPSRLAPATGPDALSALAAEAAPTTHHHANTTAQLAALLRATRCHRLDLGDLQQAADHLAALP